MITTDIRGGRRYAGNGATASFDIPWRVDDADDVSIVLIDDSTLLESEPDYEITDLGEPSATVVLSVAPAAGSTLLVAPLVAATQPVNLRSQRAFNPEVVERALDRAVLIAASAPSRAQVVQLIEQQADPLGVSAAILRADLMSSSEGKGADMLPFNETGTGAIDDGSILDVARGSPVLPVMFGVQGDGATDDGTALGNAAAAAIASGRPLSLRKNHTYAVSQFAMPAGLVLETNGASFAPVATTTSNSPLITVASNVRVVGPLVAAIPAGMQRDRVLSVTGDDCVFEGGIDVSSVNQQANSTDNDDAAVRFTGDRPRFGRLRVDGFDQAVQFKGSADPSGLRFDITRFTRAVHLEDTTHVRVAQGGHIHTASANATYTPGHVGVLVSASVDDATTDVVIPFLTIENAGEHGVRVAGPGRISDVHFDDGFINNCGGSGYKILGTDTGTPTSRNRNITFHRATIQDCGTGGLTSNMCGILAMFCDGVYADNVVIRSNGKLQSAHTGVRVAACSDVRITADVNDATFDGFWLDGSLGDLDRVHVGGISRANGRDGYRLTAGTSTIRRATTDLVCDGNTGIGLNIAVGGGTMTDSLFRAKLHGNTGGSAACDSTSATLDFAGLVGAITPLSGIIAADASTWRDTGGLLYRRVASKWRGKGRVVVPANVVNDNAVANTMQDVTGLALPVVAGRTYDFRFVMPYSAAATTTGSRWSINGPVATFLRYRSEYSLGLNSRTINEGLGGAYDAPAAANTDSAVTVGRNLAIVEGRLVPNVDGTLQARFASEVAGSAITATSHGYLDYEVWI